MTGGIGFSRDGNNTLEKNREILKSRKSNANNPYWGSKKAALRKSVNLTELIKWKKHRASILQKRSALIFIALVFIALLLWGIL